MTDEQYHQPALFAAAPELLDLAKCNLFTMEEQRNRCLRWGHAHNELDNAITDTRAAIAKAKGVTNP